MNGERSEGFHNGIDGPICSISQEPPVFRDQATASYDVNQCSAAFDIP